MNQGKNFPDIISGILFAGTVLFSNAICRAQGGWEQITSANSSLPSDSIRSIAVDSTGNVWVATLSRTPEQGRFIDAGVSRFDGSEWKHELATTTAVRGLVTAPNGILYAIVFPAGKDPLLFQRKEEWKEVPSDRTSTSISETIISRDGSLFGWETDFAQPWFYFYQADPITGEAGGMEYESWLPSIGEGSYEVSTGIVDGNNALWIIADQYEWVSDEYRRKEGPSVLLSFSLDSPGAAWEGVNLDRVITSAAGGRTDVSGFAATDGFLVHRGTISDQNWRVIPGVTSAQRVAQDMKGNFWIVGTTSRVESEERVMYYDVDRDRLTDLAPLPHSAASITGMVTDRSGNLWIGYNGTGIDLWRSETSGTGREVIEEESLALSVVPNPTRGASELRCTIPGPSRLVVEVCDELGRRIEKLYEGEAEGGDKTFIWNGAAPSGEYFYRISTRFGTRVVKFVRIGE